MATTRQAEAPDETLAEHRARPRVDVRTVVQSAVLAAPVLLLATMGWARRWMCDDGYIHLRVVQQVLAGHGPVFNAGERIEASTSPPPAACWAPRC